MNLPEALEAYDQLRPAVSKRDRAVQDEVLRTVGAAAIGVLRSSIDGVDDTIAMGVLGSHAAIHIDGAIKGAEEPASVRYGGSDPE